MNFKNILLLFFTIVSVNLGVAQNLVTNGDFSNYNTNCNDYSFAFTTTSNNCVPNWNSFSGSPSLHGVSSNPHAWMWSGGSTNHYESIQTPIAFENGKCYTVSFKVRTNDRGNQDISDHGTINVRAVNFQNGTILNEQTIFSNTIGTYLGNNWHLVTTTFTPNANYARLLINPLYTGGVKQAEMAIDDIVIEEQNLEVNFHFEDSDSNTKDTFCDGETILLNGSASQGEVRYFIDAWRRPTGSTGNFQYVSGLGWTTGQLQTVNLTTLFAGNNVNFEAGYEYEIKVALGNDCIGWLPLTKRFTVLPNVGLDSNFIMNTSCAGNGTITVQVTATNPNAYQWWGLFETPTSIANGGTQIGPIQGGTTVTFSGLSRTKNYYIKHGVWKDSDENCYPWQETRKIIPSSVSWAGYTTDFALSVSSNFNGQVSVNVQADSNPVSVYHGWQVYDVNHNVISGFCCNSDVASFQGLLINTWYYVKHGIWNDCKEWQETRKYFRVQIQESENNIGGFILETKEYPFEPDSAYTKEINELVNSGAIYELYEEYERENSSDDKNTDLSKLEMYPNPVQSGSTLTISGSFNDPIKSIELVELSGKSTPLSFSVQKENILLEIDSRVSKGMYFVRIIRNSGEVITQQLAIQ
ncbi:Por secretion system C-terminal sorting domain-containing protein [Aquimarina amphilecti]|uniref:Por secretion system C-terminal sorting domain-containing protein n=1 Tax=Aquimarina amphilecti TaxID=1038014 RepID=A0A1H7N176_AQUAM|nr:T9SS type A sorting domain-containing protein [Aquimarina amphilecti]SEL16695.1 Por secretion system C-terminal sorting domain-containing protein [Aquimarina amphilecti]